ncbi:MAG: hypothetical protein ACKPCI_28305, partial [Dolichospermum sp.]
ERLSKVGNTISRVSSKTSDISRAVASPRRWIEAAKLSGKLIVMGIVIENTMVDYNSSLDDVWDEFLCYFLSESGCPGFQDLQDVI